MRATENIDMTSNKIRVTASKLNIKTAKVIRLISFCIQAGICIVAVLWSGQFQSMRLVLTDIIVLIAMIICINCICNGILQDYYKLKSSGKVSISETVTLIEMYNALSISMDTKETQFIYNDINKTLYIKNNESLIGLDSDIRSVYVDARIKCDRAIVTKLNAIGANIRVITRKD